MALFSLPYTLPRANERGIAIRRSPIYLSVTVACTLPPLPPAPENQPSRAAGSNMLRSAGTAIPARRVLHVGSAFALATMNSKMKGLFLTLPPPPPPAPSARQFVADNSHQIGFTPEVMFIRTLIQFHRYLTSTMSESTTLAHTQLLSTTIIRLKEHRSRLSLCDRRDRG